MMMCAQVMITVVMQIHGLRFAVSFSHLASRLAGGIFENRLDAGVFLMRDGRPSR